MDGQPIGGDQDHGHSTEVWELGWSNPGQNYSMNHGRVGRDVRQRQQVSMAMAVLTEREQPLHPFPLQLLLAAVAATIN